ncbi:MAG: nucleoside triphosphate pyrophosphohydrolase [Pseudomonadota bacterium]
MTTPRHTVSDLLQIMRRLRDPQNGCPWDIAQSFESIVPSTLEECYELAAAIEAGDFPHVADELGDVLFQVVFYAQLGTEKGYFNFDEIVHGLASKLLRRHPHVFPEGQIDGIVKERIDAQTVKAQWESIKAEERADRSQHGAMDDVPTALPALPRAQKLQKRAARVGFDWDGEQPVLEKLAEETGELHDALVSDDPAAIEDEIGDLLFTVVNLARHRKIDAESALRRASSKFERRFRAMEIAAAAQGATLDELDAAALDELWRAAKRDGNSA